MDDKVKLLDVRERLDGEEDALEVARQFHIKHGRKPTATELRHALDMEQARAEAKNAPTH